MVTSDAPDDETEVVLAGLANAFPPVNELAAVGLVATGFTAVAAAVVVGFAAAAGLVAEVAITFDVAGFGAKGDDTAGFAAADVGVVGEPVGFAANVGFAAVVGEVGFASSAAAGFACCPGFAAVAAAAVAAAGDCAGLGDTAWSFDVAVDNESDEALVGDDDAGGTFVVAAAVESEPRDAFRPEMSGWLCGIGLRAPVGLVILSRFATLRSRPLCTTRSAIARLPLLAAPCGDIAVAAAPAAAEPIGFVGLEGYSRTNSLGFSSATTSMFFSYSSSALLVTRATITSPESPSKLLPLCCRGNGTGMDGFASAARPADSGRVPPR